tara:strand:+ start:777 stop:986 length:210 start_codon:yes stop_codon:yes gene_type:complete
MVFEMVNRFINVPICSKQFLGGERINPEILWEEYLRAKQTYLHLSKDYKRSKRSIPRKIDLHQLTVNPN